MEQSKNLAQMCAKIHTDLLETIFLVDTLDDLIGAESKEGTIIEIILKNLKSDFETISECRKLISPVD